VSGCGKVGGACWCRLRGWVGRCPYAQRPPVRMSADLDEISRKLREKLSASLERRQVGAGWTQEDVG
jgi:hypothetical protein